MIPLGIGGVYTIIYILSPKGLFPSLYKMAEVICFIFPAFMECLILARLLPSNDSYMDLWQISSAGGGLMDFEGNIFYSSEKCLPVKKEQIITAKRKKPTENPASLANDTKYPNRRVESGDSSHLLGMTFDCHSERGYQPTRNPLLICDNDDRTLGL